MSNVPSPEPPPPVLDHQILTATIQAAAQAHQGDCLALLALLRSLESLHQQIRDNLFQPALPNQRQALYTLLRDIELEGGWPYIPRMKLAAFLAAFGNETEDDRPETKP